MKEKKGTKTESFGSSEKIGHDASMLYNSKMYAEIPSELDVPYVDNSADIPKDVLNAVILGDSQNMDNIPDNSVHLMITSPPYNVRKDYDDDLTISEYLTMLERVFREVWRVLVTGGRAAINVSNVGRKPYIPLNTYITDIMTKIGFIMREDIIWDKGITANSTAWGSFKSASNPTMRHNHEYILVFSKQKLSRPKGRNSISKKHFIEWTRGIWKMNPESAKKIGHPAPFPEELPRRLIDMYSFEGDVILDPFIGSGTTGLVALKMHRNFIGYERDSEYVDLARKRINPWKKQKRITNYCD